MDWIPVSTRIWSDPWVISLGVDDKLMWVFLITSTDYGFIEYSPLLWALQTGLDKAAMDSALQRFEQDGRILRDGNMLCLPNTLRHRHLRGNNYDGAVRHLRITYGVKFPKLLEACLSSDSTTQTTGLVPRPNGVATSETSETKHQKHQTETFSADSGESPPPARGKRIKPEPVPLAEIERAMPMDTRPAWYSFKAMVAGQNRTGTVAESRLVGLWQEIERRCEGMSYSAIAHGLTAAACKDNGADPPGAPNAMYVYKAARGYETRDHGQACNPQPVKREPIDMDAFAAANGLTDAVTDAPPPERVEQVKATVLTQGIAGLLAQRTGDALHGCALDETAAEQERRRQAVEISARETKC